MQFNNRLVNNKYRYYKGIDINRVVFASLIPLLHIGFSNHLVKIISQYISRLGVPFFFMIAGMFLAQSMERKGASLALRNYFFRIGRMLLFWLLVYFPMLLLRKEGISIQEVLFKTPAYLWYLTGLLFATVPFCLIRHRKHLLYVSIFLYIFGTIVSESYRWIVGGFPLYESIFLTTRNGLFFALPLMCFGELSWKRKDASPLRLALWGGMLFAEITVVGINSIPGSDRSMYFFLPLFMYEYIIMCRKWNPEINTKNYGGISSAIYLMQFGIITIVMKIGEILVVENEITCWVAWLCTIIVPTLFFTTFRNTRLARTIF